MRVIEMIVNQFHHLEEVKHITDVFFFFRERSYELGREIIQ